MDGEQVVNLHLRPSMVAALLQGRAGPVRLPVHWPSPVLPAGLVFVLACSVLPARVCAQAPGAQEVVPPAQVRVEGDGIPQPLTGRPGDPARGRAIITDRSVGLCLLCHSGPFPEQRFQGNLAPSLAGAGSRWNAAQLRLRMVDSSRLNPATIMPSYYRLEGLARVGSAWQGKTVLSAQQVEDVVAFLTSMRDQDGPKAQPQSP